jgi:tubulin beta
MSREIIQIQVGQCGNAIGTKFWENISAEHGLENGVYCGDNDLELEGIYTYFNETKKAGVFTPRAVVVDLDPSTKTEIDAHENFPIKAENCIFGETDARCNWAAGYYNDGADPAFLNPILEAVRREAESCRNLSGFQIVHSLGGGTGSGLGTLLLDKLSQSYPECICSTYSVFPSPTVSDVVIEPYNALLAMTKLIDYADFTIPIANGALHRMRDTQDLGSLNQLAANAMTGLTSSFRFPGDLNQTLSELTENVVTVPRLHFPVLSFFPTYHSQEEHQRWKDSNVTEKTTVQEVINQLFSYKHSIVDIDHSIGRWLSVSASFRGTMSMSEINEKMEEVRSAYGIPDESKHTKRYNPPSCPEMSGTLVGTNTAVKDLFEQILERFGPLWERKLFLHSYLKEGLEELEVRDAANSLRELITEYSHYQGES